MKELSTIQKTKLIKALFSTAMLMKKYIENENTNTGMHLDKNYCEQMDSRVRLREDLIEQADWLQISWDIEVKGPLDDK